MKKIIALVLCVLFIAAVFSGCSTEKRAGFDGNFEEYDYYYEKGRNKEVEEDILYLTKTYFDLHPTLTEEKVLTYNVSQKDLIVENNFYYNEDIKNQFVDFVDLLIPKIEEMTDIEVFLELEKLTAITGDANSFITYEDAADTVFPILLWGFYSEDGYKLYVRAIENGSSEFMYSELVAINGVTIEDITEKLKKHMPVSEAVFYKRYYSVYFMREYLSAVGVMKYYDESAVFTFVKEDGTKADCELYLTEFYNFPRDLNADKFLYFDNGKANYWYEKLDEETLYIRIGLLNEESFYSFKKFTRDILAEAERANIKKTVIDFRGNGGGTVSTTRIKDFVNTVCKDEFGKIYILSDEANTHLGVHTAGLIKHSNENAVIVGAPAQDGPNIFTHTGARFTFPNSDSTFLCSDTMLIAWPDYEYDVLMPDVEIHQTLEDYKNGVDTVLEAVLAME